MYAGPVLNCWYGCLLVLLIYQVRVIHAMISSITETTSNTFGQLVQSSFGLARNGIIEINYDITLSNNDLPYQSYILILIISEEQRLGYYSDLSSSSSQISSSITNLCSSPSMNRMIIRELPASGSYNYTVGYDNGGTDDYSVAVLQCRNGNSDNPVRTYVQATMKNPNPRGDGYNQLSIDYVMLVRLYLGEIFIYTLLLMGVIGQFIVAKNYALAIHRLFAITVISYFVLYIVKYVDINYQNVHGTENHSTSYAVNIIQVVADTLSLASLFYLSLGWSVLRQQLTQKEHNLITYAISGFLVFDMGAAVCTDGQNQACQGLSLVSFIIKSLVLLAIIVAMNFTVTQLRAMLTHTPWVPSTPIQYARCKQFQIFRLLFILYLLLPTSFLILQVTMYTWVDNWLLTALNDFLIILMIFHIGVTFGPLQEPLLVRAFDGTALARPQLRNE